ncbi:MAG: hypothetical protein AVDCRST_MAG72-361, partial [uncultured Nocardioidaceae bacterium]
GDQDRPRAARRQLARLEPGGRAAGRECEQGSPADQGASAGCRCAGRACWAEGAGRADPGRAGRQGRARRADGPARRPLRRPGGDRVAVHPRRVAAGPADRRAAGEPRGGGQAARPGSRLL